MQVTTVPGPAGALEARLWPSTNGHWAVFCHPHPLYGGSMDDAVIDLARTRFAATGGGATLFNFRGVGASDGQHDGGAGEVDDVVAVVRWLADHEAATAPLLVGYSFGSAVAWRAAAQLDAVTHTVLIAPPIGSMAYPHSESLAATVIAGSMDPFVDAARLDAWLAAQPGATLLAVAGADHFFLGHQRELAGALDQAFGSEARHLR